MNQSVKWAYAWALFCTVIFLGVQVMASLLVESLSDRLSIGDGLALALDVIPALLCILLITLLNMRMSSISWGESLRDLGFKKINQKQLFVGLLLILPTLAGYLLGYWEYDREGVSLTAFRFWPSLLLLLLISSGFYEEVLFRGFIFRRLRKGRSFLPAAAVSSALWAGAHAIEFFSSTSPQVVFSVEITVIVAFIFGFALAYLYEKGGNVLWGCILAHFLFNFLAMVDVNHEGLDFVPRGLPAVYIFGGMFISTVITFLLANRFLPKSHEDLEAVAAVARGL